MALNAAYHNLPVAPRIVGPGDEGGVGGGSDGGDGGDDGFRNALFTLLPAVYDNGGVAVQVSYVSTALGPLEAAFAAVGYATEGGFIVNEDGTANVRSLVTATAPSGPPPMGVAELNTLLTKDGATNITRWIVRLGP